MHLLRQGLEFGVCHDSRGGGGRPDGAAAADWVVGAAVGVLGALVVALARPVRVVRGVAPVLARVAGRQEVVAAVAVREARRVALARLRRVDSLLAASADARTDRSVPPN